MSSSTARQTGDRPAVFLLLGAVVFLYLKLFTLPHTPVLLTGDQVYFWTDAQRMLDGQRIYQDFFQFTPPGTDLIFLAMFKLFGLNIWVTNLTVLLLGVALCWVCFRLAGAIMHRSFALFTTAFFLVAVYGKILNATHHWFSFLAIMASVAICFESTATLRVFAAGALLGLASFFTQTHGVVALLAFSTFLLLQHSRNKTPWPDLLRRQATLFFAFLLSLLSLSTWFLATAGFQRLWYFQVTYVHQYMVDKVPGEFLERPNSLILHSPAALLPYLIVAIAVAIYPATVWQCWRNRRNPGFPWDQIVLLSLVGSFLMVECAIHPNWTRFYAISLPVIVLTVWMFIRAAKPMPSAALLMSLIIVIFALRQIKSVYINQPIRIQLPAGQVATTPAFDEMLSWLAQHTQPGDFFFRASWPGFYVPLHLRNPLFVDELVPREETRPQYVELAIQQLDANRVQYILWAANFDLHPSPHDHLNPLREYLRAKYTPMQVFSDGDTIWQRNDTFFTPRSTGPSPHHAR